MPAWMEPVLNHLWQSTLVVAAAALVVLVLREYQARVRYGIWFAASLKFLVPFSLLGGLGASLSWVTEPVTSLPVTMALRTATVPFSRPEYTAFPVSLPGSGAPSVDLVPVLLILLWGLGSTVVGARWAIRWRTLAHLRREAVLAVSGREHRILRCVEDRLRIGVRLPLALMNGAFEPGLFGVVRPVLLWPRTMSAALEDDQIEAIIAHELCHAQRRDNVTAAVHMTVETLFWFHPLTWWIGARLIRERERACDEWVVTMGSAPQAYAEGILRTCRFCLESPLPCASGVTGADLRQRIERIVTAPRSQVLGGLGAMALVLASVIVVGAPVAAGGLIPRGLGLAGSRFLQSPRQTMAFAPRRHVEPAAAARARFAAVSIAPAAAPRDWGQIRPWASGRFTATGVTLRELIAYAYSPESPLLDVELIGAAAWMVTDRFDLVARSPRPLANDAHGVPSELIGMIRNMLADRFDLRIHTETRQMVVFDLVRAARGSFEGLRPTSASCWRPQLGPPPPGQRPSETPICRTVLGGGRLSAEAVSIAWLSDTVGSLVRQVVRDVTGLGGRYDVDLTWAPTTSAAESPIAASLREQLGLGLVEKEGPVEVLVISGSRRPVRQEGP